MLEGERYVFRLQYYRFTLCKFEKARRYARDAISKFALSIWFGFSKNQ
jgi:hypothetical protein